MTMYPCRGATAYALLDGPVGPTKYVRVPVPVGTSVGRMLLRPYTDAAKPAKDCTFRVSESIKPAGNHTFRVSESPKLAGNHTFRVSESPKLAENHTFRGSEAPNPPGKRPSRGSLSHLNN